MVGASAGTRACATCFPASSQPIARPQHANQHRAKALCVRRRHPTACTARARTAALSGASFAASRKHGGQATFHRHIPTWYVPVALKVNAFCCSRGCRKHHSRAPLRTPISRHFLEYTASRPSTCDPARCSHVPLPSQAPRRLTRMHPSTGRCRTAPHLSPRGPPIPSRRYPRPATRSLRAKTRANFPSRLRLPGRHQRPWPLDRRSPRRSTRLVRRLRHGRP